MKNKKTNTDPCVLFNKSRCILTCLKNRKDTQPQASFPLQHNYYIYQLQNECYI